MAYGVKCKSCGLQESDHRHDQVCCNPDNGMPFKPETKWDALEQLSEKERHDLINAGIKPTH